MQSVPYQIFQLAKRSDNRPGVAVGIIVGAIAFFLVLVIVGCVAVFGVFKSQVDNAIANASDSALEDLRARGYDPDTYIDADGRVQDQKVYHYAQSEDFERYDAAVRAMFDKYKGMSDEEVNDILPEKSEEAVMQYGAFLMILTDLKSANSFGDSRTTTDPQEITDYYNAQIAYINDLEQRFLKGKALGTTVRIKKSDGTYFEVDGDEDPSYKKPDDVKTVAARWEEKIKAVPIGLGADGTYLQTGEALVQSVGLTATYDYQSVFDHCTRGRLSNEQTLAAYCSATQNMIYINQGSSNFANDVRDSYYPNAVKHELAHAMIHRICGSTAPPVGVDVEALTNSYTVLYFGGDYDHLQSGAQNAPWYQMTDASHEAAKAVHNGQCKVS